MYVNNEKLLHQDLTSRVLIFTNVPVDVIFLHVWRKSIAIKTGLGGVLRNDPLVGSFLKFKCSSARWQ